MTKASIRMNKSMWIGVAAGIGIATAGGVAAYSYLGEPSAALSAGAQEECWDEQVVTVADPTDRHRIAGTAIGAVVGGAVGRDRGAANRRQKGQATRMRTRTITPSSER